MTLPALTAATATALLGVDGLRSMGLGAVFIAPSWSSADLTFDPAALTLTSSAAVTAPFNGTRRDVAELARTGMRNLDGTPRTGQGALLELHPQAVTRLEALVTFRLGATAGPICPVPAVLALGPSTGTLAGPQLLAAGDQLATEAGLVLTFHDRRGRIVCPIAAAALLNDLATTFGALAPAGAPSTALGGLASIAGKATQTAVHVVDPHGMPFAAPANESPVVLDNQGNQIATIPASGLVNLQAGQRIGASTTPAAPTRLRLGWARNARLGNGPLVPPPTAPANLGRRFLRVCAVDLNWHLLGNRTGNTVQGIGPEDQALPANLQPLVRDQVNIDFLADGVDALAHSAVALGAYTGAAGELLFGVSPTIRLNVGVPPAPNTGAAASPDPLTHWPAFPAPPAGAGGPVSGNPAGALTAVWSGQDVALTIAAGTIARGSHVRVYPQRFRVIRSIGPEPSFVRGDGGASIVANEAQGLTLLVENPLGLEPNETPPAGASMVVDVVVTSRANVRQTFGGLVVPIGSVAPPAIADPFGPPAAPDPMAAVAANQQGLAPSPVFGMPGGPLAPGPPATLGALLRALSSETAPRIPPRLPTMARFPTLIVTFAGAGPAWSAVVTGGRWARQTRSAMQDLGNPGGPSGADVHAAGVRVDAALAFDVANTAMRRVAPVIPLPGSTLTSWLVWVGANNWIAPAAGTAPAPATCAGAVLRTIATGCETPELEQLPVSAITDNVQSAVAAVAAAVGGAAPAGTLANATAVVTELRREVYVSQNGQRDALWALMRAIGQATQLVFVASPQFCPTARPGATPAPHEIDLVAALAARLAAQPALRVIVATPRLPDADPGYGGWVREALSARAEAYDTLTAAAPDRVAFFHPGGFPGRDAAIRTTAVVVDDTWALVGTSHWRRRGMTFDEGVDVAGFDRALDNVGASTRVRQFRRALMAAMLRVPVAATTAAVGADWVRLSEPQGSFDLVTDVLVQGGLGRILPFWRGPTDTDVVAQTHDVADPDGVSSDRYLELFAGLIGEGPDD